MYKQGDKSQDTSSRTVSRSLAQQNGVAGDGVGFVDNRQTTAIQRKIQTISINYQSISQGGDNQCAGNNNEIGKIGSDNGRVKSPTEDIKNAKVGQLTELGVSKWLADNGVIVFTIVAGFFILLVAGMKRKVPEEQVLEIKKDGDSKDLVKSLTIAADAHDKKQGDERSGEIAEGRGDSVEGLKLKEEKEKVLSAHDERKERDRLINELAGVNPKYNTDSKLYLKSCVDGEVRVALESGYRFAELQTLCVQVPERKPAQTGSIDDMQVGLGKIIKACEVFDEIFCLVELINVSVRERLSEAEDAYDESKLPTQREKPLMTGTFAKEVARSFGIPGCWRNIERTYGQRLRDGKKAGNAERLAAFKDRKKEEAVNVSERRPVSLHELNKPYTAKIAPRVNRWGELKVHFLKAGVVTAVGCGTPLAECQYVGPTEDEMRNGLPCFNFGHIESFENRRFIRAYSAGYINAEGYVKSQLNPKLYQMETVKYNRSHVGEADGNEITKEIYTYLVSIDVWKGPSLAL